MCWHLCPLLCVCDWHVYTWDFQQIFSASPGHSPCFLLSAFSLPFCEVYLKLSFLCPAVGSFVSWVLPWIHAFGFFPSCVLFWIFSFFVILSSLTEAACLWCIHECLRILVVWTWLVVQFIYSRLSCSPAGGENENL